MTTRTLAFISSVALLAPSLATEAYAQRPGGARPPVVQSRPAPAPQGYDRDGRDGRGGDYGRDDRFERERFERARFERERERLAAAAFRDGYEAGLRAARDRRRFEPMFDSRYRSADRGYHRDFGPRDRYHSFYRDAFRRGFERGFADAFRVNRPMPGLTIWWRW